MGQGTTSPADARGTDRAMAIAAACLVLHGGLWLFASVLYELSINVWFVLGGALAHIWASWRPIPEVLTAFALAVASLLAGGAILVGWRFGKALGLAGSAAWIVFAAYYGRDLSTLSLDSSTDNAKLGALLLICGIHLIAGALCLATWRRRRRDNLQLVQQVACAIGVRFLSFGAFLLIAALGSAFVGTGVAALFGPPPVSDPAAWAAIAASCAVVIVLAYRWRPFKASSHRNDEELGGIGFFVLGAIVLALLWFLPGTFEEVIWDLDFGRQLAAVRRSHDVDDSIAALRRLLGQHQVRARPYWLMAGYYAAGDRPTSAIIALKAYRHELRSNPYEDLIERMTGRQRRAEGLIDDLTEKTGQQLASTREDVIVLARTAAAEGRVRVVRSFEAQDVLLRPATQGAGVLNLDYFEALGVACQKPENCKSAFARIELPQTTATVGEALLRRPGCCSLSLDDPDLRTISIARVRSDLARSPAMVEPFLAAASRMLFKQYFMFNFAVGSRS